MNFKSKLDTVKSKHDVWKFHDRNHESTCSQLVIFTENTLSIAKSQFFFDTNSISLSLEVNDTMLNSLSLGVHSRLLLLISSQGIHDRYYDVG